MSKFVKWVYNLHAVAKPIYRKYHAAIEKAPLSIIYLSNEQYFDFGDSCVAHRMVGDKLVEVPYCSNGIEIIMTPPFGEVSDESIADNYEGHSG